MESIDVADLEVAQSLVIEYGLKVLAALAIFVIGRIIAKWLTRMIRRGLERAHVDAMLVTFTKNISYVALMTFVVLAVLNQFGVQTTSFIAIIGAAGLAVGLALQGSLANFAAGVLMILFRPFKVGDYVEAAGTAGSVEEIMIFSTKLVTPDNREVIVPNGAVMANTITNYSARETRRVDMVFGVGYGDDLKKARSILEETLETDERILKDPPPTVGVLELGDNSVNFAVRPWVKSADYWSVYFDLHETIKLRFDSEGISIPFPQRDIHVHQVAV